MKKTLLPILVLMMLHGCGERKKEAPQGEPLQSPADSLPLEGEDPTAREYSIPYFKAQGTEPFWGLNILGDRIVLSRMMGDSLVLPHPEPIRVQDSNIKMYRSREGDTSMDVIITQKECTNAMSGEVFPYEVTISYVKGTDGETQVLEGCGEYFTDSRLNDIWVLEELEGQKVTREDFNGNDLPYMELYTNENRFSGFSGCNRMTGTLFFEWDVLRFGQIASTLMACPNMEKEDRFLKVLQGVTKYSLENNRLYLSTAGEAPFLTFKKID